MLFTITFVDENLKFISREEHEFKVAPVLNEIKEFVNYGKATRYKVLTVGGPGESGSLPPTRATFQAI